MLQNQEKIDKNIDQGKFFTNVKQEKNLYDFVSKLHNFWRTFWSTVKLKSPMIIIKVERLSKGRDKETQQYRPCFMR